MSIQDFNDETIDWLGEWMSQTGNDRYEMTEKLSLNVQSSLLNYMNTYGDLETYELYRGVDYTTNDIIANFDTLSSWSLDPVYAENFGPNIMYTKVSKNHVLIDTTLFMRNEVISILGGFPDEQEVILFPDNYKIEFI